MLHTKISRLLAVLFLLGFAVNAFAQRPISLGLRGGVNFASDAFTGITPTPDVSSRTGFGFGGVAEMGLSDLIYLQAEPRYIQKGTKISFAGQTFSWTLKVDYFEIPVSLLAKFGAGAVKPYIFAGPTISFLLSAKTESDSIRDIKDQTESNEFSLDVGAGVAFTVAPKTSLTGDVRYSLGLTKLNKPSSDPLDTSTWKSRDIKVFVGLLFTL
jgi:hypothetical protein